MIKYKNTAKNALQGISFKNPLKVYQMCIFKQYLHRLFLFPLELTKYIDQ